MNWAGCGRWPSNDGPWRLWGGVAVKASLYEQIYEVVRRIPAGRVATYGQIARLVGKPRAARAVGWAMRATPAGVPWQRVINSRGTISFAARSEGAVIQRALLEAEGIVFDDRDRVDLGVHGWAGLDLAERDQILSLSQGE